MQDEVSPGPSGSYKSKPATRNKQTLRQILGTIQQEKSTPIIIGGTGKLFSVRTAARGTCCPPTAKYSVARCHLNSATLPTPYLGFRNECFFPLT